MTRRAAVAVPSMLIAAALVVGARQETPRPEKPPIFRGGVAFVTVDVYPRQNGTVVEGLHAEDFRVFEDGKPQTIETFELVTFDPLTPDAERRDPGNLAEAEAAARDPHNRVYVVYLDPYHVDVSHAAEAPSVVAAFLQRAIGPRDVFGVMTPETPVGRLTFSRRTETVEEELRRSWAWGIQSQTDGRIGVIPQTDAERAIANVCGVAADDLVKLYREDLLMTSLEQLMLRLGDLRDERKNVLFLSEGWEPQPPQPVQTNGGRLGPPPITVGPGGRIGVNQRADGGPQNLDAECLRLTGRLSNLDFARRFQDLIGRAQRANVSFYPLDLGGLKVGTAMSASSGAASPGLIERENRVRLSRRDTLLTLADNTDGMAVVDTNDLAAGARRIADAQSGYYLLGYYSTNAALDGRYRKIEVKVTRPGLTVAARPGYLAPTAEDYRRWSAPPVVATGVNVTDVIARMPVSRADMQLLASAVRAPGGLDVVVELPPSAAGDTRWAAGADVTVTATSTDGAAATASARMAPGEFAARVQVPLAASSAGPWQVRVRAAAGNAQVETRVQAAAAPQGPWLGAPRVFRAGQSPRAPARPTAIPEFRRSERLIVELPLTPGDSAPRDAQVLDRRGQPLKVDAAITQAVRPADGTWQITVAIAALAEGEYVLHAAAGGVSSRDQQLVAFRVVR